MNKLFALPGFGCSPSVAHNRSQPRVFTLILSLLLAAVVLAVLVFLTRHRATRHRRAGEGGSRAATFRGCKRWRGDMLEKEPHGFSL